MFEDRAGQEETQPNFTHISMNGCIQTATTGKVLAGSFPFVSYRAQAASLLTRSNTEVIKALRRKMQVSRRNAQFPNN